MIDFKEIIAQAVAKATNIEEQEIYTYIEVPKDTKNGDYAFPCFRLAKVLRKAPPAIAEELKANIENDNYIDTNQITKIEIVGGYLNFFVNKKKQQSR